MISFVDLYIKTEENVKICHKISFVKIFWWIMKIIWENSPGLPSFFHPLLPSTSFSDYPVGAMAGLDIVKIIQRANDQNAEIITTSSESVASFAKDLNFSKGICWVKKFVVH